ncbi:Biotin-requiring enzyme [Thermoanaerobacter sp. YS13]|uniref:biotin/lipoyl-containing protein n=1 Tax=Thermoanaerobacter sp. YS13 TaxID=1511746 RepID=UPI0005736F31|nr:biotin/lipoyl-containing protein [Thermoanaerobacter sp. YS13]KHO62758.1 Biotin-requiring enzyme [Thermoanaerobacter sp. YS13]
MRRFIINVNGKDYEVEIEEIREGITSTISTARTVENTKGRGREETIVELSGKEDRVEVKQVKKETIDKGHTVTAPMPGTIVDVKIKIGDVVKRGDVLLILEAMKMENEIITPIVGRVVAVNVQKGSSVKSGDILVILEA